MNPGCSNCPSPEQWEETQRQRERWQPQPGTHQQRSIVSPTGSAPGYRVRRVRSLPPGGQNMDFVWSDADNSICVWVDDHWVCFGPVGGGADCMFNYLVSVCWADLVALPNSEFTEGMTIISISGCPFKIYSQIQPVLTHAATTGEDRIAYICDGDYPENLVWSGNHGLLLLGSSREGVRVRPSTGDALTLDHVMIASGHRFRAKEITFQALNGGSWALTTPLPSLATGDQATFEHCRFFSGAIFSPGIGGIDVREGRWQDIEMINCSISNIRIGSSNSGLEHFTMRGGELGGFNLQALGAQVSRHVHLLDVTYIGDITIPTTDDFVMTGRFVRTGAVTRGITLTRADSGASGNAIFDRVYIKVLLPQLTGASVPAYGIYVADGTFIKTGTSECIHPYPASLANPVNYWKVGTGGVEGFHFLDTFPLDNSSPQGKSLEENSAFKSIDASSGFIRRSHVNCGGAPYQVAFGSGGLNTIDGHEVGIGPPSHESHAGAQYFDATASTWWQNNADGANWVPMAGAGGGAAASEPYIVYSPAGGLPNSRVLGVTPPISLDLATPGQAIIGHENVGGLPDAHHAQLHGIVDHTLQLSAIYIMLASAGPTGYAQAI